MRRISALTAANHLGDIVTLNMTKHTSYETVTTLFLINTCLLISYIPVSDTAHLVLAFNMSVAWLTRGCVTPASLLLQDRERRTSELNSTCFIAQCHNEVENSRLATPIGSTSDRELLACVRKNRSIINGLEF